MARKGGINEGGPVVEQDVDVEQAEAELKKSGKKTDDQPVHTNGHRPISRSQFLFAAKGYKPKVEIVDLPEVPGFIEAGSQIKVRELRSGERDAYENKIVRGRLGNQKVDLGEMRIGLIIKSAVEWDDEETPLFQESDREWLKNMGISVIQAIYNVASKLSAVSKEDEDELVGE